MGVGTGIVAFVIIWWLVLFLVLPWGIQQNRAPNVGEDRGAPLRHRILLKAMVTTGITLVLWGVMFTIIELDVFSFRDFAGGYRKE